MSFFNSLSTRVPLAVAGGILYSGLTYSIIILLNLPFEFAIFAGLIVFLFYLGSRLLLLFSGIETPYYSRDKKVTSRQLYENTSFYQTAQWVGKFYYYHDWILFIFLIAVSIIFLTSLLIDWRSNKSMGETIQDLLNALIPLS